MAKLKADVGKTIFLSFVNQTYSRSAVYMDVKNPKVEFHLIESNSWIAITQIRKIIKANLGYKVIFVVMSPCHKLVPIIRLQTKSKIILDAGWPLIDGIFVRHFQWPKKLALVIKIYIIDFVSFQLSHKILFETNAQRDRCIKIYQIRKNKSFRLFTGFNEEIYLNAMERGLLDSCNCHICNLPNSTLKVFFRGAYNDEAGIEEITSAARALNREKIVFIIAIKNLPKKSYLRKISNVLIIESTLTETEIAHFYLTADITLGQLSSSGRLKRTIPHKAFEAAYFAKPYVTANSGGIREFLTSEDAFLLESNVEFPLANAIIKLKNKKILCENLSISIKKTYQKTASQEKLRADFESIINL